MCATVGIFVHHGLDHGLLSPSQVPPLRSAASISAVEVAYSMLLVLPRPFSTLVRRPGRIPPVRSMYSNRLPLPQKMSGVPEPLMSARRTRLASSIAGGVSD